MDNESQNNFLSQKVSILRQLFPKLWVLLFSTALTGTIWFALSPKKAPSPMVIEANIKPTLFAAHYPANTKFQTELTQLKNSQTLQEQDELEIHKALLSASEYLDIPQSLLWCLLFQESRLNHLEGIENEKASLGLGQFSRFSFFEVNYQLERYSSESVNLLYLMFGHDIRPITAKKRDLLHPSSYYSIPTAVVASALYLNNRYKHLTRLLDNRAISYDPDIIWLFSAMAYNKGTRSVLNLWNTYQKKKGPEALSRLLNDLEYFRRFAEDSPLMMRALNKIWEEPQSHAYSKELQIHTGNIMACAVSPLLQPIRHLTEVER
ncbi:MAG: hypothetical protein FJ116_11610 [Deltaproteobacteria bacterium]|nr:hypothetical protein [Deltaproteobacteria bacterium]